MIPLRHRRGARLCLAAFAILGALVLAAPASANAPRSNAEREFLVDMVGHHAMAVSMAEMAKEKATHQELKTLADDIIRTQTAEIRRMRGWLKAWYDRRVTDDHMVHGDMRMLEEASGPAFEVRFTTMMSVHHTQAIERARAVRQSRLHRPVRELTGDIIRAQRREIGQLQEWLVAWYAN
jgi:uncharacterized protein (DUF305 family)